MAKHSMKGVETVAQTDQATKKFLAWLDTFKPRPVDAKERERMAAAIAYDLEHLTKYAGITKEQRLETFKSLGYIYENPSNP